ncbi:uncharacterized protein BXZ73DRAFT_39578 [Epithele typhae]|uniref:uncharacterized protein n=1 Tax=Epithele typhae TaxID=378194 RepID=UPI0020089545|nr:uncharacterized protein BXZ73DRAFT_39578 [Epithele typhae]KAH9944172.1 hypothetical protein BXZ73DRAFT_39578 [Epithele typhae]
MVSPLWKACSEGNVENVAELLKEATSVDIEVKDHTGVTPLIEAVKNGHVEIVRMLLDKGAEPTNASSQGPPESYTSEPVIHGLLSAAKSKMAQPLTMQPEGIYQEQPATAHVDPAVNGYYPPPGAYYYPPMPGPPPVLPEGAVPYYMPPPPMQNDQNGFGNLPPPEVARMIPCRYYPACRYGASCMFAHPQAPFMQGPNAPPPPQYGAPYDTMNSTPYPPPMYYPVPPGSYPPNSAPVNHMSPPPMAHARSGSEAMSPVQGPFSPSNGQPPMPYGVVSPVSPPYGGHVSMPVSVPPLPPLHNGPNGAQSPLQPATMYPPISPSASGAVPPYAMPPQFAPQHMASNGEAPDVVSPKSPVHGHPHADAYNAGSMPRDMGHHRRGSARRPSFGGRGGKPPCLFFPSGRCRNGDECRFPHVLPDGSGVHHPSHFSARGGHRPRPPFHPNGVATLEDKFAVMTTHEEKAPMHVRNGTGTGTSTTDSSRSQSAEPGHKGRPPFKPSHFVNGAARPDRKFGPIKQQRVPNADEFPVLNGSTPISRASSLGNSGPTAAQILQAPAPRKEVQTRGSTPDLVAASPDVKPEINGIAPDQSASKRPISFAAAATGAPEPVKELSVAA